MSSGKDTFSRLPVPLEQQIWYYPGDGEEKDIDPTTIDNNKGSLSVTSEINIKPKSAVGPLIVAMRTLQSGDRKAVLFHREVCSCNNLFLSYFLSTLITNHINFLGFHNASGSLLSH